MVICGRGERGGGGEGENFVAEDGGHDAVGVFIGGGMNNVYGVRGLIVAWQSIDRGCLTMASRIICRSLGQ